MLPPVRERQDLGWVIDRVLALHGRKTDGAVPGLHADTKQMLLAHSWPGNLRELRNVIEFAAAVCRGDHIMPGDLPEYLNEKTVGFHPPTEVTRDLSIEVPEASELYAQLKACRWNVTAAAQAMGISRMTLYRRMKRYGIEHPQ